MYIEFIIKIELVNLDMGIATLSTTCTTKYRHASQKRIEYKDTLCYLHNKRAYNRLF